MTLEASSEIVLATTAPQPSSNALPMTFAFVPGGPEPMMKGFGSFKPLTVVSSDAMTDYKKAREPRRTQSAQRKKLYLLAQCSLCPLWLALIVFFDTPVADHHQAVQHERDGEGDEPGVGVNS